MTHPAFVVVSGLPGSGKSTVARALAPRLGLPILDKDEILERLFDRRGIGDAAWRRQLSRESDALLMTAAVRSPGAVIASFWHMPGMSPDSGTPTDWLARLSPTLVEIHPDCAFARMAGRPLPAKRSARGRDDRVRLVEQCFGAVPIAARGAQEHDVLDAWAVLWSARRYAAGTHVTFGDGETDDAGLPMRIVS